MMNTVFQKNTSKYSYGEDLRVCRQKVFDLEASFFCVAKMWDALSASGIQIRVVYITCIYFYYIIVSIKRRKKKRNIKNEENNEEKGIKTNNKNQRS